MRKPFLVADSGGTQTDWCLVNANGEREYFTTSSYHPSEWGEDFDIKNDAFWRKKSNLKSLSIYFFGAGCLHDKNKKVLASYFEKWGFIDFSIFSDVEAACFAVNQNEAGCVAILGTGSVVCEWKSAFDFKIIGGLGYLLGDEGSGYYFGKLLIQKLLSGELNSELSLKLFEKIGDRPTIMKKVYGKDGKSFLSSISFLTQELTIIYDELIDLHRLNFSFFVSKYLNSNSICEISVVGSYGFYHQEILRSVLIERGIQLKKLIQYPIENLTDYIENFTL